jgi:hypothetical protein
MVVEAELRAVETRSSTYNSVLWETQVGMQGTSMIHAPRTPYCRGQVPFENRMAAAIVISETHGPIKSASKY